MGAILGWILTIVGIVVGVYGAIQLLVGAVPAIRGPERAAPLGVALGGVLVLAVGALITWGGRRLRRPRRSGRDRE